MATSLELQHFAVLEVAYFHSIIALSIFAKSNNPCHLTCYYTDNEPLRHATSRIIRGTALPWGAYWCFSGWKTVEQEEDGDTLIHSFLFSEWPKCSLIGKPWTHDFAEDLALFYEPWGTHLHDYNLWFIIADPTPPVITFEDGIIKLDFFGCAHAGITDIVTDGALPLEGPDGAPCYIYTDIIEVNSRGDWDAIVHGFYCKGNGEDILLYLTSTIKERTLFPTDKGYTIERGIHVGWQYIPPGITQFNLLELWKDTRSHFGLETDYENWYISQYEIANRNLIPALTSYIRSNALAIYYPPPKPPVLRWFSFRGTIEDELSPSVTALMSHCHSGIFTEYLNVPWFAYWGSTGPDNWAAQTFTPQHAHTLISIRLPLLRSGTPGTITASIKATDPAGHPIGPDLSIGTIDGNTLTEDYPGEWRFFNLTPLALNTGTKYAILLRSQFASVLWPHVPDNQYPRGQLLTSGNAGETWNPTSRDFIFECWGIPA